MAQTASRTGMAKAVYFLCAFHGLGAALFGGLMMLFPVDAPFGLAALLPRMGGFPFQVFFKTLFWPGLALFLCNGVCNLTAAGLFLRKRDAKALLFGLIAGVLLIVWDVYELAFLPNPLAALYVLLGVVQAAMCYHLLRKDRLLRAQPQAGRP